MRSVRFRNVPSFVWATGLEAAGRVVDVAFGGAFYASLEERVEPAELPRLIALGREIKAALEAEHEIVHPLEPELRDVYGVIFWQEEGSTPLTQRNVTVFADGEVDRSPCGSGTSARLALLDAEGRLPRGAPLRHLSIVGSEFTGRVVDDDGGRGPAGGGHRGGGLAPTARAVRRSSSTRTTRSARASSCGSGEPSCSSSGAETTLVVNHHKRCPAGLPTARPCDAASGP